MDYLDAAENLHEMLDNVPMLAKYSQSVQKGENALREIEVREKPQKIQVDRDNFKSNILIFRCLRCNHAFSSYGFQYCPYCGAKLPTTIYYTTPLFSASYVRNDEHEDYDKKPF